MFWLVGVVLFLGVLMSGSNRVFVLVELDGFEVEFSFLSSILEVGLAVFVEFDDFEREVSFLSSEVEVGFVELVGLRGLVWFFLVDEVGVMSLVWFLVDTLGGFDTLVWFLLEPAKAEVEVGVVLVFDFCFSSNIASS